MRFPLEQYLPAILVLCVECSVRRLELFGSAARDEFDPGISDLDFFVEFLDLGWQGSFKRYMGLKLGLEDLLGCAVDLVELSAVRNPHFLDVANRHRRPVYAA
jgi:hypothetical protein